ncbi:colicin V production protein [Moraxella caviae]|nr:colicin V production protein [Moraxella caviae]VEW10534.1 colicin V production protein [Moraxella caviae]
MVLVGLWRGFQAGALKTAARLVAWVLALIIASKTAKDLSVFFVGVLDNPVLQTAAAFLLVAVGVVAVVHLATAFIASTLKAMKLGFINRLAGGALGALVGVFKVLIVLSIASPLLVSLPVWQESMLAQSLLPYAPVAKTLLQEAFGEAWQHIENPYA